MESTIYEKKKQHYQKRVFWVFLIYLPTKTLKIHVSRNDLSFSDIGGYACILSFLYDISSKTLKIHVFNNVILFLFKVCFAFWYLTMWKTLKIHFLVMLYFSPCSLLFIRFNVLVRKKFKTKKKKKFKIFLSFFINVLARFSVFFFFFFFLFLVSFFFFVG